MDSLPAIRTSRSLLVHIMYSLPLFIAPHVSAQDFLPLENSTELKTAYLSQVETESRNSKKQALKDFKKDLRAYYDQRTETLMDWAEFGHLVFDKRSINYLNSIKDEIARTNTNMDLSEIKLVIARYYWANAFSVGEGTIVFNVGLIPHLKSEDQLAFIMCHEFAHYLLDHSQKEVLRRLMAADSEEFRAELKDISKSEYYQASRLKELLSKNLFSQRAHSRENEKAADSLGLILFLNTKYSPHEALATINALDTMSNAETHMYINVFQALQTEEVRAENREASLQIDDEDYVELNDEKLKTHPDCDQRYVWIQDYLTDHNIKKRPITKSAAFDAWRDAMRFELCESYLHFWKYDRALLTGLRLLRDHPHSEYLKGVTAYAYYHLSKARKEYRLNAIASIQHNNTDTAYSELLDLLYMTRSKLLLQSSMSYCRVLFDEHSADERLHFSYAMTAKLNNEKGLYSDLKQSYLKRFPGGRFRSALEDD